MNGTRHLDGVAATSHSGAVARQAPTIPARWIFAAATALGVFSTTEAITYHLIYENPPVPWAIFILLNFSYWYVWAMLTPPILWVARRCPFDRHAWGRVILVHSIGVFVFTFAHSALSAYVRVLTVDWLAPDKAIPFSMALRQRFVLNFDYEAITYWFLVGISHALDYRRQSAERSITAAKLQARLAEANLEALQRQLHPHFLFNTLHTISALMHRDIEAADAMLARLSDLLRLTLHRVRTHQLRLKEELDFIEKYLEIERARYGDRLRVVFDIDPAMLDTAVPSMVLQPLVENALRHGIGPKVGGGQIDIIARRDDDQLWLIVRDDGYGVPADELDALNEGVGVSNTRARLQHLYGDRHRFEFRAPRGGGLEVRVAIPVVQIPDASEPAAMESVA
jgi:signal transduction histidine kinase